MLELPDPFLLPPPNIKEGKGQRLATPDYSTEGIGLWANWNSHTNPCGEGFSDALSFKVPTTL